VRNIYSSLPLNESLAARGTSSQCLRGRPSWSALRQAMSRRNPSHNDTVAWKPRSSAARTVGTDPLSDQSSIAARLVSVRLCQAHISCDPLGNSLVTASRCRPISLHGAQSSTAASRMPRSRRQARGVQHPIYRVFMMTANIGAIIVLPRTMHVHIPEFQAVAYERRVPSPRQRSSLRCKNSDLSHGWFWGHRLLYRVAVGRKGQCGAGSSTELLLGAGAKVFACDQSTAVEANYGMSAAILCQVDMKLPIERGAFSSGPNGNSRRFTKDDNKIKHLGARAA
jgi:hypothetical protein